MNTFIRWVDDYSSRGFLFEARSCYTLPVCLNIVCEGQCVEIESDQIPVFYHHFKTKYNDFGRCNRSYQSRYTYCKLLWSLQFLYYPHGQKIHVHALFCIYREDYARFGVYRSQTCPVGEYQRKVALIFTGLQLYIHQLVTKIYEATKFLWLIHV